MSIGDCGVHSDTMEIYWSDGGTTYTEISGSFNAVDAPEQARIMGTTYKFGSDLACVDGGHREPVEVTLSIIYDSAGTNAFQVLFPYFTNGSQVYIQWHPEGSGSGSNFTAHGYISNWVFPGAEAGSSDVAMGGITVMTDEIDVA
jgi:hypothetical protein